jgi:hypothetical protein
VRMEERNFPATVWPGDRDDHRLGVQYASDHASALPPASKLPIGEAACTQVRYSSPKITAPPVYLACSDRSA